jgi:putative tricarboxylic transport membrane protein
VPADDAEHPQEKQPEEVSMKAGQRSARQSLARGPRRAAAIALAVTGIATGTGPNTAHAAAAAWKPEKNVEIVINTAPGSGQDTTGRMIQRILNERRIVEAPIVVVNRPGGGGAIAYNYLNQHQRDGHYSAIISRSLLTNHIMGRTQVTHTHITPLAVLFEEYIAVAVKADSPITSGRQVLERMSKDPNAYSIGVATSIGNSNHQGVASALKHAGVDLRKTRTVVFQSGGNAITALLGGHVDIVPGSVGLMLGPLQAGTIRVIAVAAPQRLGGKLSVIPTWREQGADAIVSNWRGIGGPGGMTAEQIAYWDNALRALTRTDEWKKELERNNWDDGYKSSAETRKYLESDYADLRVFLTELELAKSK